METKVAADVSSFDDIGGVVLQLQPDDSWRPVSFISRAMTPTETRYAQIEKNALALTWACKRSWEYIYRGKVELCGNRLETPGAVSEYSYTESTSTTNQKISNATNEIPLQGDQACSRKEDAHNRCVLKTPSPKG